MTTFEKCLKVHGIVGIVIMSTHIHNYILSLIRISIIFLTYWCLFVTLLVAVMCNCIVIGVLISICLYNNNIIV